MPNQTLDPRYWGMLKLWTKVVFNEGQGVFLLRSNMQLNMSKTAGFNNQIFVLSSTFQLGFHIRVNECLIAQKNEYFLKIALWLNNMVMK